MRSLQFYNFMLSLSQFAKTLGTLIHTPSTVSLILSANSTLQSKKFMSLCPLPSKSCKITFLLSRLPEMGIDVGYWVPLVAKWPRGGTAASNTTVVRCHKRAKKFHFALTSLKCSSLNNIYGADQIAFSQCMLASRLPMVPKGGARKNRVQQARNACGNISFSRAIQMTQG